MAEGVERLSITLPPDEAARFNARRRRKQINKTEATRRAYALWDRIEGEVEAGHRIVVVDKDGNVIRELVFVG